jgi:hypothetical protein
MRSHYEEVVALTSKLNEHSNLNADVIHNTSLMIQTAANVLSAAQRLQVIDRRRVPPNITSVVLDGRQSQRS